MLNRRFFIAALAALIALPGSQASAQRFGQWWWQARVGAAGRNFDNEVDGELVSSFEQQDLEVGLDVNGYIVHPAVSRFRLGVDFLFTDLDGGRAVDTDRSGLRADLELFPRGSYPLRVYYRQQLYDYSASAGESADVLSGLPDENTRWGGRFHLKKGPLQGTLFGVDHSEYDLLGTAADQEVQDQQFVDWSRSGDKYRHHARIESRSREYGILDLETDDLIVNVDERIDIAPRWRWQLSGFGLEREFSRAGEQISTSENYRLRNRVYHDLRERDRLDIFYTVDLLSVSPSGETDSHFASVFYRWRPSEVWEVAPFVQFSRQSRQELTLSTPRAGVSLSWTRDRARSSSRLTLRASQGEAERTDALGSRSESQSAFAFVGSLTAGDPRKLRRGVDVELGRNEQRLSDNIALTQPDVDLLLVGLGSEDFARTRVTLGRRWDGTTLDGWIEWTRRESSSELRIDDFTSETYTSTVQLGGQHFNLRATAGRTEAQQPETGQQDLSFAAVSATMRPHRTLRLWASHRVDERDLILSPNLDGERSEIGLTYQLGQIVIEGRGFDTREQLQDGFERTNRGIIWSVRRELAGWLPIRTGGTRRGVVR